MNGLMEYFYKPTKRISYEMTLLEPQAEIPSDDSPSLANRLDKETLKFAFIEPKDCALALLDRKWQEATSDESLWAIFQQNLF